jgi:hypothetical protein
MKLIEEQMKAEGLRRLTPNAASQIIQTSRA